MEQQITLDNDDKKARNWDLIQFKTTTERKLHFRMYCQRKGFPSMSAALNMVIAKLLDDDRTMPDPRTLKPIENAIDELKQFLPVMERYGMFKNWEK